LALENLNQEEDSEDKKLIHLTMDYSELVATYLDVFNSISNLFESSEAMERSDTFA